MSDSSKPQHELKRNAIGVWGIVFFVVAAAAPLGATTGAGPWIFSLGGAAAAGMFLVSSIVLLLFAVGFATMSRYVTSAGGFAAFASRGLGRPAGHAMGGMALLAYSGMLLGIFATLGVFASDLADSFFGLAIPWQPIVLAAILVVGIFGYLDIGVSAKVLGVLMVLEVLIILVFDFAVIFQGGEGGLNLDGFSYGSVSTSGLGVALLLAFGCFVGFEATTIFGEEARDPRKTVPRATYLAIFIIGIFYTLTFWAIGLAYGSANVQQAATDDPVNFVFNANSRFVGQWSTDVMQVLVLTSLFAVLLSFHNTLARYFFSLGRARFLPMALGRTHPKHKSPSVASVVLSIITLVVLGAFMLGGADPFAVIYLWLVSIGTLGVLVLQFSGAAAVVGYFLRQKEGSSIWKTAIAPVLGGLGLLVAIFLAFTNFDALAGTSEGVAGLLPWLVPLALVAGLILGFVRTRQGIETDLGVDSLAEGEPASERRSAAEVMGVFEETLAVRGSQE